MPWPQSSSKSRLTLLAAAALGVALVGCAAESTPPQAVGSTRAKALRERRRQSRPEETAKADTVATQNVATESGATGEVKAGSAQSPLLAILDDARAEEVTSHLAIPTKVTRYAQKVVTKYDGNADGVLTSDEWQAMRGSAGQADFDHDGRVTPAELAQRIAIYSLRRSLRLRPMPLRTTGEGGGTEVVQRTTSRPRAAAIAPRDEATASRAAPRQYYIPQSKLPAGVDEWFLATDGDGDGQITMNEFTAQLSEGDVTRFAELDPNGDGVVTAVEYAQAKTNPPAEVAPPEAPPMDAAGLPPMPAPQW